MPEKVSNIEHYKASQEQKSKESLGAVLSAKSPDEKEAAIQALEADFEGVESMDDTVINEILTNVDRTTRDRLIQKITESAGLNGDLYIKDSSEKWLKISVDTNPITQDRTHGWVIHYKMLEHEVTDPKTGEKRMEPVQDDSKNAVRKNNISSFIKFKKDSPQFRESTRKAA